MDVYITKMHNLFYSLREIQLQTVQTLIDLNRLLVWCFALLTAAGVAFVAQPFLPGWVFQIFAGVLLLASAVSLLFALFSLPFDPAELIPETEEIEQALRRELELPIGDR